MAAEYRADQVGSLLRPAELLAARDAAGNGEISTEELRRLEDRSVLEALEMQLQTGIGVTRWGASPAGLDDGPG